MDHNKKIANFIFCEIVRRSFSKGGGTRNRTLTNGFGDRCSTTKLYPQYS